MTAVFAKHHVIRHLLLSFFIFSKSFICLSRVQLEIVIFFFIKKMKMSCYSFDIFCFFFFDKMFYFFFSNVNLRKFMFNHFTEIFHLLLSVPVLTCFNVVKYNDEYDVKIQNEIIENYNSFNQYCQCILKKFQKLKK